MGLDATNKVLLRFKSACSATVTSWKIKISQFYRGDPMVLLQKKLYFSMDRGGPTFLMGGGGPGSKC